MRSVRIHVPTVTGGVNPDVMELKRSLCQVASAADQTLSFSLGHAYLGTKVVPFNELAQALAHFRFALVDDKATLRCMLELVTTKAPSTGLCSMSQMPCPLGERCKHLAPISLINERGAIHELREVILQRMSSYGRGWAEDSERLRLLDAAADDGRSSNTHRESIALRFALAERELLQSHLRFADFALLSLEDIGIEAMVSRFCAESSSRDSSPWFIFDRYVMSVVWPLHLEREAGAICGVGADISNAEVGKMCSRQAYRDAEALYNKAHQEL
jgi:hypothetical protein